MKKEENDVKNGLPKGWQIKHWNDVLTIKNGKNQKLVSDIDGKYPIYGSGGIMGFANDYLCNEGTTIVGRKGSINNPIYVEEKFWNVDTAFGICSGVKLNSKFLFYFCLNFDFSKLNKSTTLPSLTKTDLLQINIPLPPLNEQHRIVRKLDELFLKIDNAIGLTKENLEHSKHFYASALNEMFDLKSKSWKEFSITEKFRLINGRAYNREELLLKGKYKVIRIQNLNGGENWYYSDLELDADKYCNKNDLLYSWSGTPHSSFGAFIWKGEKSIYHYHTWKVEFLDKKIDLDFAYHLFSYVTEVAISQSHGGTGMMHITKGKMELLKIRMPDSIKQKEVANYLNQLSNKQEQLVAHYSKQLKQLEGLKASLLDGAFKGEI